MTVRSLIRDLLNANDPGCETCRRFCRDPDRIETELPGLATLSSSHAAVRARDGLCLEHGVVVNGRRRCVNFQ